MDFSLLMLGVTNLIALAGLIFKAGSVVTSITRQDVYLNTVSEHLTTLSQEVNALSQRVSHLEGLIRQRRGS